MCWSNINEHPMLLSKIMSHVEEERIIGVEN